MQIQRIKTLSEIDGSGSNVITKDYFDSNPIFYYCYRIFPFERGHGIFVANSIRRFLLYEIPTIAITSVLIRTVKENLETDEQRIGIPPHVKSRSLESQKHRGLALNGTEDFLPGAVPSEQDRSISILKSSSAQMKKKKVTKKALKEQAAELFSYTSDPFAQTSDPKNIQEVDLLSANLETSNQQSEHEVSSLTEFTTIPFVRESFLEILLNLKACVFENIFTIDKASTNQALFSRDKAEQALGHGKPAALLDPFEVPPGGASKVLKGKLILNASPESLNDPAEVSKELFFQTDFQSKREPTAENPSSYEGRRVREYKIWAKDLILPPGLKVKNPDLVLATLVAPKTNCELDLNFEKIFQPDLTTISMKTGRPPHRAEQQRRNVPIDGTLFPIKKVNFALSYTKFQKEVVTFEIWTNGSVNPKAAIFQCVEKILTLFENLRESQVTELDSFAETAFDEFE